MIFFLLQLVWSYFKESILILVISSFFLAIWELWCKTARLVLCLFFFIASWLFKVLSVVFIVTWPCRTEILYLVFTSNYVILSEDKRGPQILCPFLCCGDWKLDGFSLQTSAVVSLFAWIHIDGNVHLWTLLQGIPRLKDTEHHSVRASPCTRARVPYQKCETGTYVM